MSLPSVIARMRPLTLSVSRDNVTVAEGLAVLGAPTTFTISASVQPVEVDMLKDMPEGQNVYDRIWIYTLTELKLRTSTTAPDVVTYNGAQYRVIDANYYGIISNHWRCQAEKVNVP